MSWPNPFRRHDENTRNAWGYTFQWTSEHKTAEELHPLKFTYDALGEECLNRLDKISPPATAELPRSRSRAPVKKTPVQETAKLETPGEETPEKESSAPKPPKRDLYALLREHAPKDEKLGQLWDEVNTVPDWVDWEQIERGQRVFYRYGGVALSALAYQSLLGGMGAARVTEVLARTGGFSPKVARGRMFETTQHILQVTHSLESIKPGGAGHASSVRVRLLHAAVRRRILALAAEKPAYYSVEQYGIPINDLDSIATIMSFSATLIWLGFPRQGIWLRAGEIDDYLALWRLVAHYLGTPTDSLATPHGARAFMESLLLSEINPSPTSKVLANNIILSLQDSPPAYASREFLHASARWLNGDELADALGLDPPRLYYKALVLGQCLFFMALCYTYRSVPALDRRKIAALRRVFYALIVTHPTLGLGAETDFGFKHIPQLDTLTLMSEDADAATLAAAAKGRPVGVERRNLTALVIAGVVVAVGGYVSVKIGFGIWSLASRLVRS